MNEKKLQKIIIKSTILQKIFYRKMLKKNSFIYKKYNNGHVSTKDIMNSTKPLIANFKNKDSLFVGLVKDKSRNNYCSKYEKFLIQNKIKYEYYDPFSPSFIEEAKKFNLIIWRVSDKIPNLEISKNKIYFLERILKLKVYPSFDDVWCYEDKSLEYFLFEELGVKHIPSFYTNNYNDALNYIKKAKYPIVNKEVTSFSSFGVSLLKNKRKASKFIKKAFGEGARSSYPWAKQKDYVLFQEYIPNAVADIRVVCVGGEYFAGYYRLAKKNDFRASGSGLVIKKEIPEVLLRQTKDIFMKLGYKHMFAVDYLETENHEYLIIESSQFIGIETPQQTKVDGVSGIYHYNSKNDSFDFIIGDIWLQELDLKLLLERNDK